MKTHKITSRKWIAGLSAVCLLSLMLTSCLKDKTETYVPPAAFVQFVQASPGEQPLDLYLNTNKVNLLPIGYGDRLDYFRAYSGTRIVNMVTHPGNSKIFSDTVNLKTDSVYSMFLINKATNPGLLLLPDSLTKPAAGKGSIRFVNVSPDAPAVDLAIKDTTTALVANKAFKGYSPFFPIQASKTYTFEVRQHGTNTVLATLANVNIYNGQVYTIWLHGLVTTTIDSDKLKAEIITNAVY